MAKKEKTTNGFREIRNSKAFHEYFVEETFEAGIELLGTEVKSIRMGKAQISDAFVRVEKGQAILYHAHIDEYAFGNIHNHNPLRPRRLLLHKREIRDIQSASQAQGMSVIPLRMYIKHGLIKLEIAICKGKKLYDKRETLKKKMAMREAEKALRYRNQ